MDHSQHMQHSEHSQHSPYAAQKAGAIKALTDAEVASYKKGEGMGLAKAAELNSYPGPMHVLELADQLSLSADQKATVQESMHKVKAEAARLGETIVENEAELDKMFRESSIDPEQLRTKTEQIAKLQGELRNAHLQAHIEMKKLLTPEQVENYDRLRGYKK